MASVGNAFDLLIGTGEQVQASKKKKKSKPKPKPADAPAAAASPSAPAAAAPATDNGSRAPEPQVVPVAEVCALLEKSARTFKSGTERLTLWKQWIKQGSEKSGVQYRDADGSLLDFKQVLLRSKALEITAEGCIISALLKEQSGNLQALLNAFTPTTDTAAVASSISRLATLLSEDTHSFDTVSAAQRAVHSAVAALKGAKAAPDQKRTSLSDRLAAIDRQLDHHQAFLNKTAAGGLTKQHVESAQNLVKLQAEKFDLLQPSGGRRSSQPASPALTASLKALEELKGVIAIHLKEAVAADQRKGQPGSKEAKGQAALDALRREEAALNQQAADLASQIRALEHQLSALRAQASDVEDRRTSLAQRKAAASKAAGAAGGAKAAAGVLGSGHYQEELAAAETLLEALDPSAGGEERELLEAARGHLGDLAGSYMACLRQLLSVNSTSMEEVPKKLAFCKSRIQQADKMSALGASTGKQKEDAERLMADALRSAEDLLHSSGQAVEGMRQRFHVLNQWAPEVAAALSAQAYEIEDMFQHTRGQFEAVFNVPRTGGAALPMGAAAPGGPPLQAAAAAVRQPAPAAPQAGPAKPAPAANGSAAAHAAATAALAAKAPAPARPASAAAAAAAAPAPAAVDGFQPVGGKKNRRKA